MANTAKTQTTKQGRAGGERPVRLAVVGAGLVGSRHVAAIAAAGGAALAAVVDPARAGREAAAAGRVPWFAGLDALLDAGGVDGVVLATPNRLHAAGALACIERGLPVLVEKPLTDTVAAGAALVAAAEAAGVPLLTGHHRRHNPIVRKAKALIDEGALGPLTAVHAQAWFAKPGDYFDVAWRTEPGAGPVFINLIHDIDLLQHLCGPIVQVQAMESNARRGHAVEDTAVILLRFANGVLGTMGVSDAAAAPWSWEMTSAENPAYPATDQDCYRIAGTAASLALPSLTLWRHEGRPDWWQPIAGTRLPVADADPLVLQIENFAAVIRGADAPLVSGADGLSALKVIDAAKRAAARGGTVEVG